MIKYRLNREIIKRIIMAHTNEENILSIKYTDYDAFVVTRDSNMLYNQYYITLDNILTPNYMDVVVGIPAYFMVFGMEHHYECEFYFTKSDYIKIVEGLEVIV